MSGLTIDPEDMPTDPQPGAPPWHIESHACDHGWIGHADKPYWLVCDCEDPANPWPVRESADGPVDCTCAICLGHKPRWMRGKLEGCEYKNHHCPNCHEGRLCTVVECGFNRYIDEAVAKAQ